LLAVTPPVVSVVIASGAGGEFLFRALNGLQGQTLHERVQVIVVDRVGAETASRLEHDFPWVELVRPEINHRPSVPELRAIGIERATADVVAVLEEHCVPPDGWLAAIKQSFRDSDAAIGGPILDDRYERLRDWVVYFSEYHNYLPPWREGERFSLNGANIAYHRGKLLSHRDVLTDGYWEVVLHPKLAKDGAFRSVPAMGAIHTGPFDFRYYLKQRYLLSRVWGGTRRKEVSPLLRVAYLALVPILPLLLLARIGTRVFASGRLRGRFIACVPLLLPVTLAYVWGECLGFLLGPGTALEHVE
jgi:hypothetical protein